MGRERGEEVVPRRSWRCLGSGHSGELRVGSILGSRPFGRVKRAVYREENTNYSCCAWGI